MHLIRDIYIVYYCLEKDLALQIPFLARLMCYSHFHTWNRSLDFEILRQLFGLLLPVVCNLEQLYPPYFFHMIKIPQVTQWVKFSLREASNKIWSPKDFAKESLSPFMAMVSLQIFKPIWLPLSSVSISKDCESLSIVSLQHNTCTSSCMREVCLSVGRVSIC